MRRNSILKIQRILFVIGFIACLALLLTGARILGYGTEATGSMARQGFVWAVLGSDIAIISGHAGNDSGATCEDENGRVLLTEADVVAAIAQATAQRLRQTGATVTILQEYDERLQGLQSDLLLSLHADSCLEISGYKAARGLQSQIPERDDRLVACIDQHYPAVTQLQPHQNSITHDMTEYHAYRRIDPLTPAAILEIGFLGGDQALLTEQQALVAKGIVDSVLCFMQPQN